MLESLIDRGFEVLALHHAEAILTHDMPEAVSEIESVLEETLDKPPVNVTASRF